MPYILHLCFLKAGERARRPSFSGFQNLKLVSCFLSKLFPKLPGEVGLLWSDLRHTQHDTGQFLDRSPTIRAQLSKQLGLSTKGRKLKVPQKYRSSMPAPHSTHTYVGMSGFNFVDRTRDNDGQTFLGFINEKVNNVLVRRCLVDCKSLSELISLDVITKLRLKKLELREKCKLKMTDDSTSPISHYVVLPFIVGGILLVIRAFQINSTTSTR